MYVPMLTDQQGLTSALNRHRRQPRRSTRIRELMMRVLSLDQINLFKIILYLIGILIIFVLFLALCYSREIIRAFLFLLFFWGGDWSHDYFLHLGSSYLLILPIIKSKLWLIKSNLQFTKKFYILSNFLFLF